MNNKTYKDIDGIKNIIQKICEVASPFGQTEKTAVLKNQLEAVAEVAFINGQMNANIIQNASDNHKDDVYYNLKEAGEAMQDSVKDVVNAYNSLQKWLGSDKRISIEY